MLPFDPDLASVTAADVSEALRFLDGHDTTVHFESTPAGVYYRLGKAAPEQAKNFEAAIIIAAMYLGWSR